MVSVGLSEIPGESQRIRFKSPGETGGYSRGVPSVSLSSDASSTDRTGILLHSEVSCRVPVKLQVLYEKCCFLPSTHPTTWEGDTSAYLEFFRVEYPGRLH